jgi:6-phosphogluconate dehydrogenase
MKKKATKSATKERLTRTLPATRVTEEVYQRILSRMEEERRRKISEVVRLTLEDHFSGRAAA